MAHVVPRVTLLRFRSCPKTIYFVPVSVPSILNGHSLNIRYFLGFSKKSHFRGPLDARRLEFRENSAVLEFNEIRLGD